MTSEFGWRGAYIGLGLVPFVLVWPVLYFLFRPIESTGAEDNKVGQEAHQAHEGLTLSEAAKSYRFWILLLSILFAYMGFSGIGPNLFPSMTDDGFSREQAATIQSVFGISIIVGRVVVGLSLIHI